MDDLISRQAVIDAIKHCGCMHIFELQEVIPKINAIPAAEPRWIPITTRPLDENEKKYYEEREIEPLYIYTCELPEDGEEVLITTYNGEVIETTFFNDDQYGSYFELYEDYDDVKAWMHKPAPYGEKVSE